MDPASKDRSLKLGEFISHVFDIYFPFDREYEGDFDGERSPLVPGDEGSSETDRNSKSAASD